MVTQEELEHLNKGGICATMLGRRVELFLAACIHFPLVSFPTQPPVAKPKAPSRILERKHVSVAFTQTRASQPRTKQTIISAFFSTQTGNGEQRMAL